MTDLERVRELISSVPASPIASLGIGEALDLLNAHLKEDAGQAKELHQAKAEWFEEKKRAREAEAELVRLREVAEQRKNKAKIARAGQQAMGQELARLREYTRDLEQTAQQETADLMRENARLREEVKHWKANAADCVAKKRGASAAASEAYHQRDTLLAALREIVNWKLPGEPDVYECRRIARAAISEIGEEA